MPLYFKTHDFDKTEHLEISRATLNSYNLPLHPSPAKVRFFYMSEMGGITNDNFMFETSIKNDFDEGVSACTRVEVLIQCVDDIIIIPLAAPGCVGDLNVYACGKSLSSKDTDLSNLGCDLREWNDLRVETINKQMRIFVNNRLACSFTFPHDPTGIVAFLCRLQNIG